MDAYIAMGCRPTWTCAPYQLGSARASGSRSPGPSRTPSSSQRGARSADRALRRLHRHLRAMTGRSRAACTPTKGAARRRADRGRAGRLSSRHVPAALGHIVVGRRRDPRPDDRRATAGDDAKTAQGARSGGRLVRGRRDVPRGRRDAGGAHARGGIGGGGPDASSSSRPTSSGGRDELGAAGDRTPRRGQRRHAPRLHRRARTDARRSCEQRPPVVPFYVNTGARRPGRRRSAIALDEAGVTIVTDTCTYFAPDQATPTGR